MTEVEQYQTKIKLQDEVIALQKEVIAKQEQRAQLLKLQISILESKLDADGETS